MRFETTRENLLRPIQFASSVVERKQTLPILSNVLIKLKDNEISVTATDLEMEIIAKLQVENGTDGEITIPVRKLLDTCKALPDEAHISFIVENDKAVIKSGRTRFRLTTISAENFPVIETLKSLYSFDMAQNEFKNLLDKTSFSMALQDVRFYLNGLLLEIKEDSVTAVATDGHRLALSRLNAETKAPETLHTIIPRKAVIEIARLLLEDESQVSVTVGENFFRLEFNQIVFTTKLIDAQYPNYNNVIPQTGENQLIANKEAIKQCLLRTSILSNEKYRGIRVEIENNKLKAQANNPDQEEAEDEIEVSYTGENLRIGFNVNYLIDAITAVDSNEVLIKFSDANGSAVIAPADGDQYILYVVMPMRL